MTGLVGAGEARSLFGGGGTVMARAVGRIAAERLAPVPFSIDSAYRPSLDLVAYAGLFEKFDLEVVDPGETELKPPTTFDGWDGLLDPSSASWVADVVGVFTGATVIAQQDAMCFLASWAGSRDGASRVFYFHPQDWGLWPTDASVSGRVFRILQEEDRPDLIETRFDGADEARLTSALKIYEAATAETRPAPERDPARWHRRVEWLVSALTGLGRAFEVSLQHAAPLAAFLDETDHVGRLPHVALYWLWSHFFLGNRHELDVTLSLTGDLKAPLVQRTREWMRLWEAGQPVRLVGLEPGQLQGLKDRFAELAPVEAFGPERRRDVLAVRSAAIGAQEEEAELRSPLEEAARSEPRVARALRLLQHLSRGGAVPPGPGPSGEDAVQAMRALADAVDARFQPLVLRRLEKSALYNDAHQSAGWGLVLAWAALAPDFEAFERELARIGIERFGPRRRAELYRAYARFSDARATERLRRAADRWLAEVDDWIRTEPVEAVELLLERDALETHELIGRLLESASFSFANVGICVTAAQAAGRLQSRRAVPGLRRAVRERLGRIGDGGRASVCVALFRVEGPAAADAFEGPVEASVKAWEATEDEDEAWGHQQDLACLMAGALPSRPDASRWVEITEALIRQVEPRLHPRRRPGPETLAVAAALVEAVRRAEHPTLARRLQPWSELSAVHPQLQAQLDRLRTEL